MSRLNALRSMTLGPRWRRLPTLPLLLLLCLALNVQCCSGRVVYQDWKSGYTFNLRSSSPAAVVAAQYSTVRLRSFAFNVHWNGDASDTFSHYSTSPHLSIHATGLHASFCSHSPVTFSRSTSVRSCNFTASWSVGFDGLLYGVYSSGFRPAFQRGASRRLLPAQR
jgi:hypothetical protein